MIDINIFDVLVKSNKYPNSNAFLISYSSGIYLVFNTKKEMIKFEPNSFIEDSENNKMVFTFSSDEIFGIISIIYIDGQYSAEVHAGFEDNEFVIFMNGLAAREYLNFIVEGP